MHMSVIVDTFRKYKRKHPDRLVLMLSGVMASFVLEDAREVSQLIGEPISSPDGYDVITFSDRRMEEVVGRLGMCGKECIVLKRDASTKRWMPVPLAAPADISTIAFAHQVAYDDALEELKKGRMETLWIWYVFPRMTMPANAPGIAKRGFRTLRESRVFLKRKHLAEHLRECTAILCAHKGKSAEDIFGTHGARHLKASATLFALTAKERRDRELFTSVLEQFFNGERDESVVDAVVGELKSPRDDTPRDLVLVDGPERVSVWTRN